MSTPAQNKAWLASHPNWKKVTAARWALKNPNAQVSHRPGIGQTVQDYKTLAAALAANPAAYGARANNVANSMFNSAQTSDQLRPQDTAQRQANITGIGNELLNQLKGIQIANADSATGNVNLFTQGAATADQAANAQAAAAGGAPVTTSTPMAAVSLGSVGANLNNIYGGQEAAAAKQNTLFHRQESQNTQSGLDKLTAQKKADYQSEYDHQQSAGDSRVANAMTYNLYNQQNTTRGKIAGNKLKQDKTIADKTAAYHTAMRKIAKENADTKKKLANGTYTPKQAAAANKKTQVYKDVISHAPGNAAGGTSTWKFVVRQLVKSPMQPGQADVPGYPPSPLHDGKDGDGNQIFVKVPKTVILPPVNQGQYDAWVASGPKGKRDLTGLGAQPDATFISQTHKTTGGTSLKIWLREAARLYMIQGGYTDPKVIKAKLDAAGY